MQKMGSLEYLSSERSIMKMSFNMDKKLAPTRGSRSYDPYEGYRLGRSAVTAEQFPQRGKTADDFADKLNRHFVRLGLQLLNEHKRVQSVTRDTLTLRVQFVGTFTTLTAEELAEELWACVPDAAVNWDGEFEGHRSIRLSIERMDRAVQRAAAFAREQWTADWEAENRRRARKGGQASKRGVSVPLEAVRACLEAVEHLPERRRATAIAELLTASGVKASARTVKRRLDELKEGSSATSTPADDTPETYALPEWDTSSLLWMNAELAPIEDDGLSDDLESWMEHELMAA